MTAAATAIATQSHDPRSIAVLPFVKRSHDEADEYFSDGLADELHNVLAKIPGLRVAARDGTAVSHRPRPDRNGTQFALR